MKSKRSALTRLTELETKMDLLLKGEFKSLSTYNTKNLSRKPIWKADEQLLMTCLKRFEPVMNAYIENANIHCDSQDNISVTISNQPSVYKLVVLENGAAIVWVNFNEANQLVGRQAMLNLLYENKLESDSLIDISCFTKFAYFLPIELGNRWALSQKGIIEESTAKRNEAIQHLQRKENHDNQVRELMNRIHLQEGELSALKNDLDNTKKEIKNLIYLMVRRNSN